MTGARRPYDRPYPGGRSTRSITQRVGGSIPRGAAMIRRGERHSHSRPGAENRTSKRRDRRSQRDHLGPPGIRARLSDRRGRPAQPLRRPSRLHMGKGREQSKSAGPGEFMRSRAAVLRGVLPPHRPLGQRNKPPDAQPNPGRQLRGISRCSRPSLTAVGSAAAADPPWTAAGISRCSRPSLTATGSAAAADPPWTAAGRCCSPA